MRRGEKSSPSIRTGCLISDFDILRVADVHLRIHDDLVALLHDQIALRDERLALALDHDDDRLAGDIQIADLRQGR